MEARRHGLIAIADGVLAALLAPACLSCAAVLDAPTASPLCMRCWRRVAKFPTGVDLGHGLPAIAGVMAIGPFDAVLRDVIHGWKFQGRRSLATELGPMLREAGARLLSGADAVVPVPLHPWRQWTRGYNQAALLASTLGLPVWHVLKRTRATPSQSRLDAQARRRNVRKAFASGGWWPGSSEAARRRVHGRVIVLVDDVVTTGATLDACARVLRAAGAREVRALAAARAELG